MITRVNLGRWRRLCAIAGASFVLLTRVTAAQSTGEKEAAAAAKSAPGRQPESIVYKQVDGKSLVLQLYKPSGWAPSDRRPTVLFFHGGSWTSGTPAQLAGQARYLAERGLVTLSAQYRLLELKGKESPAVCMEDAKSAMRWLHLHTAELGVDPARIAAGGASAGGQLAGFLAFGQGFDSPKDDLTVPVLPAALIFFNPILESAPGEFGHERVGDDWKIYSPAQGVARGAPPALIMVGSLDKILPIMERFRAAMVAVGSRCDLRIYEGQGHSFFNQKKGGNPYYDQTLAATDEFLVSLGWLPAKR